ncbi:MAG: metal ABC transporter permease [Verrucomicrobiales bacterium]
MSLFIPAWDWHAVLIDPWTSSWEISFWTVLMGFLVTATCGLVGNYLLLRRMALVGDAMSHSILFGLVVVFIVMREANTLAMFLGAIASGLLTVSLIELIHRHSRIKSDAAMCIAFTTLFALGVALLSAAEISGPVHLDAECVLYGEIAFVAFGEPVFLGDQILGPLPVVRMALVFLVVVVLIALFYKELLITAFDSVLAKTLGLRAAAWHYGLMAVLSLVIVSAFEAVGAILAIGMLIVPAMFAAQLSQHLPTRLVLTVVHGALVSLLGFHGSVWLNCSTAGAMVVMSALLFVLAWAATQSMGLARAWSNKQPTVSE